MAVFDDLPTEVQTMILRFAVTDKVEVKLHHNVEAHVYRAKRKGKRNPFARQVKKTSAGGQPEAAIHNKNVINLGSKGTLAITHSLIWTPNWIPNLLLVNKSIAQQTQPLVQKIVTVTFEEDTIFKASSNGGAPISDEQAHYFASRMRPMKVQLVPEWIRCTVKSLSIEISKHEEAPISMLLQFGSVDLSTLPQLEEIVLSPRMMESLCCIETQVMAHLPSGQLFEKAFEIHAKVFKPRADNIGCTMRAADWIADDKIAAKVVATRWVLDKIRGEDAAALALIARVYEIVRVAATHRAANPLSRVAN
jgi:hypothetical protein